MLEGEGLVIAMRSAHSFPTNATDVFLGDSIGEMGLYLRMAGIAFVGKSLTGGGGQNPLEPAVLDSAILSGPNVGAFSEAYEKLVDARGARIVADEKELTNAINHLLGNDKLRSAMAKRAAQVVAEMEGALDKTWEVLGPYVQPLIVEAGLNTVGRREGNGELPAGGNGRARIGWT
jgi:3-deoxy-D-manno-octulosonic-acid transferase